MSIATNLNNLLSSYKAGLQFAKENKLFSGKNPKKEALFEIIEDFFKKQNVGPIAVPAAPEVETAPEVLVEEVRAVVPIAEVVEKAVQRERIEIAVLNYEFGESIWRVIQEGWRKAADGSWQSYQYVNLNKNRYEVSYVGDRPQIDVAIGTVAV